jgi:predicted amidohydrolase YtcJ
MMAQIPCDHDDAWRHPDLVVINAKVITADADFSIAEAVAVRDGKFVTVGSMQQILALCGRRTARIDAAGATVVPGLIDTHAHVEAAGLLNYSVSFDGVSSVAEALARVEEMARRTPPGDWIRGQMWHPMAQLREKRFLTRWELDRVAPQHPVCLPVGHFVLANSLALEHAGITRDTPDPAGGLIHRDTETGEPNGVLEESAQDLVEGLLPPWSREERMQQLKDAMAYFNSYGITSAISAAVSPADLRLHHAICRKGEATLRLSVMFAPTGALNPSLSLEEWETLLSTMGASSDFGNEWLSFSGVKLQVDGGMTLRTADTRESYPGEPGYHGVTVVSQERLNQLVAIANRYDWRVGTHAVGDGAVDKILDAYACADQERSIRSRRFVVLHASLIHRDQMERAKALGVRIDAQSAFLWDKAATVARHLGKATADRAIPMRTLIDTMGLDNVAQGTDYPINPLDPFVNMYVMTTRKDINGTEYGPEQKVTREEAIRLYTSAASRYAFAENEVGSIEPGKRADLAILSADPLTVADEELKSIRVLRTVVGGRTVYQREPS